MRNMSPRLPGREQNHVAGFCPALAVLEDQANLLASMAQRKERMLRDESRCRQFDVDVSEIVCVAGDSIVASCCIPAPSVIRV